MKKELDPDGCKTLARMIVEYAGRDYISALQEQKRHPDDKAAKGRVEALERFFEGSWFEMLVPYNGREFKEIIKRRVKDGFSICGR